MAPPLFSMASKSQNGCDIVTYHAPQRSESNGTEELSRLGRSSPELMCRELLVECCLEALCTRYERVMREGKITADDTGNPRRRALHHGQCLAYALRHAPYWELGANCFDEQREHYMVDRPTSRIEHLDYRVHLGPLLTASA
jgi:hypothetical protein